MNRGRPGVSVVERDEHQIATNIGCAFWSCEERDLASSQVKMASEYLTHGPCANYECVHRNQLNKSTARSMLDSGSLDSIAYDIGVPGLAD